MIENEAYCKGFSSGKDLGYEVGFNMEYPEVDDLKKIAIEEAEEACADCLENKEKYKESYWQGFSEGYDEGYEIGYDHS